MSFRQLSIAPRAAIGFAIITLLLIGLGLFAHNRMAAINQASTQISGIWLPSVQASGQFGLLMSELRLGEMNQLLGHDQATTQAQENRIQGTLAALQKAEVQYQPLIGTPEEGRLFEQFIAQKQDYLAGHERLLAISRSDDQEKAYEFMRGEHRERYETLRQTLSELIELNRREAEASSRAGDQEFASASNAVIAVMAIAVLAGIVIAWLLTRSIVRPIAQAVRSAEEVASGDLTGSIDISGRDEPARLMQALLLMQRNLHDTIQQIGSSANQLASAADELNAVTEEGSRSLNQQNDEIEMAATAVNEMTAAVEEVARNATATSSASAASELAAESGRERVEQTVLAIRDMSREVAQTAGLVEGLAERAQGITKVLDVIRAIAEQTNLLALNAAIEAARAGEQGRGFAVVADEVRALAHRTQESTREIEQMIASIQSGTVEAVQAMEQNDRRARQMLEVAEAAGAALEEITLQVSQINERTLVIASAAEEQAQVAREVDRNLVNIRDTSLQTSSGARQTTAASHELSRLAIELNGMIGRFVV